MRNSNLFKHYHENHIDEFTRLYYKTDKEKINEILDRLPQKYIKSLIGIYRDKNNGFPHSRVDRRYSHHHSIMVRYDGFEFFASLNNLYKRLKEN